MGPPDRIKAVFLSRSCHTLLMLDPPVKHGMPRTILIAKVTKLQHGVRRRDWVWMWLGWKKCFLLFFGDVGFAGTDFLENFL